MLNLVTWALLVIGITYAITTSFIFAPFRMLVSRVSPLLKYGIYCPHCVSFWVGLFVIHFYVPQHTWLEHVTVTFAGGTAAMGLITLLKAAFSNALVPLFDLEQGESEPENVKETEHAELPVEKCPHAWYRYSNDMNRCKLCGMDKPSD